MIHWCAISPYFCRSSRNNRYFNNLQGWKVASASENDAHNQAYPEYESAPPAQDGGDDDVQF